MRPAFVHGFLSVPFLGQAFDHEVDTGLVIDMDRLIERADRERIAMVSYLIDVVLVREGSLREQGREEQHGSSECKGAHGVQGVGQGY
jgi:hypothetical protein